MADTGEGNLFIDHKSPTKNETNLHNFVHDMALNTVMQRNNTQTVTDQRNCVQAKPKNESVNVSRQQYSFLPVKPSTNGEHLCDFTGDYCESTRANYYIGRGTTASCCAELGPEAYDFECSISPHSLPAIIRP